MVTFSYRTHKWEVSILIDTLLYRYFPSLDWFYYFSSSDYFFVPSQQYIFLIILVSSCISAVRRHGDAFLDRISPWMRFLSSRWTAARRRSQFRSGCERQIRYVKQFQTGTGRLTRDATRLLGLFFSKPFFRNYRFQGGSRGSKFGKRVREGKSGVVQCDQILAGISGPLFPKIIL